MSVVSDSVRSHRRQPTRLLFPWDSPGKNTGVGCHFLLQCIKVKVKSLSHVRLFTPPWTADYSALPSIVFPRQEYWSGCCCLLRLAASISPPSPPPQRFSSVQWLNHVSLWLHGLQDARLPCPSPTPEACSNSCLLSLWWLCHPLLLLASTLPSIRVFSNESVLCIRWPKYWSFSFSNSASNDYSGLISFRMDWFDLLTVQGTLKSFLQHHSSKISVLQAQLSLWSDSHSCVGLRVGSVGLVASGHVGS